VNRLFQKAGKGIGLVAANLLPRKILFTHIFGLEPASTSDQFNEVKYSI
jgi:hypothetical protein